MFSPPSEHLCRRFLLHEVLSATNNFDDSMFIGKGGFGTVYKGDIIDNNGNGAYTTVAFKRLNPLSKQGAPEFWTEISMLSNFRHSHLVSLIGYCDHDNEMILVYEYMVRGTLADHLYKISKTNNSYNNNIGNGSPLSWVQRLKICIGAARGLDYLHTGTAILQRVIHRDVKSSNILLDENWAAKISDFGLSRIGPAEQEFTHTLRFTRKSDVYAFGVLLLEVLCERPAVDQSLDEDQWGLAGWGQQCIKEGASHQIIGPKLKWEILPNSFKEFVQIADQCLHSRPKQRPTMSEVVARLELALALQLRTNLVIEEYLFDTCLPVNDQENVDSYPKDDHNDKVVQLGDSSIGQFFQLGAPLVSDGGNVQDVPTSGQIVTPNLKIFTFAELKSATKNFSVDVLGEGSFGFVFKGWVNEKTYSPSKVGVGKAVAIKRLGQESMQGPAEGLLMPRFEVLIMYNGLVGQGIVERGLTRLMEVEILGKFSHPNIVKLLGYCCEKDRQFLLVYEYMLNGKSAKSLPWDTRLKIAVGTARGFSFLHATENQVIVCDIKSKNILLDGDFNAKLSGFGCAKRYPEMGSPTFQQELSGETSVRGWVGFEVMYETNHHESKEILYPEKLVSLPAVQGYLYPKSDIYSFGVVLLEILTGLRVIDANRTKKINLVEWAMPLLPHKKMLTRVVDPRLENDYPSQEAFELASLILQCLQTYPKVRPSMNEVLQSLEQINSIKKGNSKAEVAQARHPTVQREATPYKFLWSWTRGLGGSNS
ncbi:hypothetical protein LguiB_026167 [Lonicera macranthoides]